MKNFLLTTIATVTVVIMWVISGSWDIKKEEFISPVVLDKAESINATIDTDFLLGLTPAYEY